MYLNAIGASLPEHCHTKEECWTAFMSSDWFERLNARACRDEGGSYLWGANSPIAESLLFKHQRIISRRSRRRAPLLTTMDSCSD